MTRNPFSLSFFAAIFRWQKNDQKQLPRATFTAPVSRRFVFVIVVVAVVAMTEIHSSGTILPAFLEVKIIMNHATVYDLRVSQKVDKEI